MDLEPATKVAIEIMAKPEVKELEEADAAYQRLLGQMSHRTGNVTPTR